MNKKKFEDFLIEVDGVSDEENRKIDAAMEAQIPQLGTQHLAGKVLAPYGSEAVGTVLDSFQKPTYLQRALQNIQQTPEVQEYATMESVAPGIAYEQQDDFAKMQNATALNQRGLSLDPRGPDMYAQAQALGGSHEIIPSFNPAMVTADSVPAETSIGQLHKLLGPAKTGTGGVVMDASGRPIFTPASGQQQYYGLLDENRAYVRPTQTAGAGKGGK